MSKLKVAGISKNSVVDGPGLRYVIFTQGCHHNCEGCQNPQTHDPNGGSFIDLDEIFTEFTSSTIYEGITFSGGEPFLQADILADLAIKIKSDTSCPHNIICYTGYTWEEIQSIIAKGVFDYARLLYNIDYLIDGRFDKNNVSLDCNWRGSTNQRIINVPESLKICKVIEADI